MRASKKIWTDEDLLKVKHQGKVEFVQGKLKLMIPAAGEQGQVDATIIILLGSFVRENRLGRVYDAQTGFRPPNMNLRAPDVSFVRLERLPGGKSPKGFLHLAPDVAVEVFAPDETASDYAAKLREYFAWGVRLVWLVDPSTRTVLLYRSPTDSRLLTERDDLSGEDVIPGFSCRVAELFE